MWYNNWVFDHFGTIHLRRRQIFKIFDPYPLRRQIFTTICRQFWPIFDPSPQKNCRRLKWMVPFLLHYQNTRQQSRNIKEKNYKTKLFVTKGGFFSKSEIRLSNLPISQKKFQKTILSLSSNKLFTDMGGNFKFFSFWNNFLGDWEIWKTNLTFWKKGTFKQSLISN